MAVKLYMSKQWLQAKLYRDKLSPEVIAKLCGCHTDTIYRWMKVHGLRKP